MGNSEAKRIYIRADGNELIATGHIMRCLSIADALRSQGVKPCFVLADERPRKMVEERGFEAVCIHTVWDDMETEIEPFVDFLRAGKKATVLLDSYYVTENYLRAVSEVARVFYIDDLNSFLYPVDVVINYALNKRTDYERSYKNAGLKTAFLLGPKYVPLRSAFRDRQYTVRGTVERVLITTGGTDRLDMTGALLKYAVSDRDLIGLTWHVIVGRFNENKEALFSLAGQYDNIVIHENVDDMAYWMTYCDVAVSAAGTTTYELCACGIPAICFEVADNQAGACMWEQSDYMFYAGNAGADRMDCVRNSISMLKAYMADLNLRQRRSQRMQSLIDGLGAERIAASILEWE